MAIFILERLRIQVATQSMRLVPHTPDLMLKAWKDFWGATVLSPQEKEHFLPGLPFICAASQ